jgi:hypothetical protein
MAFPTSPSDGDLYTNALGVVYQYVAAGDKWILAGQQLNGYILYGTGEPPGATGLPDGTIYVKYTP